MGLRARKRADSGVGIVLPARKGFGKMEKGGGWRTGWEGGLESRLA